MRPTRMKVVLIGRVTMRGVTWKLIIPCWILDIDLNLGGALWLSQH